MKCWHSDIDGDGHPWSPQTCPAKPVIPYTRWLTGAPPPDEDEPDAG